MYVWLGVCWMVHIRMCLEGSKVLGWASVCGIRHWCLYVLCVGVSTVIFVLCSNCYEILSLCDLFTIWLPFESANVSRLVHCSFLLYTVKYLKRSVPIGGARLDRV